MLSKCHFSLFFFFRGESLTLYLFPATGSNKYDLVSFQLFYRCRNVKSTENKSTPRHTMSPDPSDTAKLAAGEVPSHPAYADNIKK